jgi:hypothetical protein
MSAILDGVRPSLSEGASRTMSYDASPTMLVHDAKGSFGGHPSRGAGVPAIAAYVNPAWPDTGASWGARRSHEDRRTMDDDTWRQMC